MEYKDLDDYFEQDEKEEQPDLCQGLTREIWNDNFKKNGFIYIEVGDEPKGWSSRVYKDNHREFIDLDENYKIVVKGIAPDFDWEKALNE